jgi:hypothetical protein
MFVVSFFVLKNRSALGRIRVAAVRVTLTDATVPAMDEQLGMLRVRNLAAPLDRFALGVVH